ncbi:hypothetical protein [Collimonas antrihumi]|uniref:hypothetical protein n=1 Tax=Collimonas antrihumi TaxID=1940615 RepID=UPI001B8A9375|nr:hypothetical protein [Collimonas antrihumi]
MSTCAKAVQQQDGSYLLVLDPSVTIVTTCQYVVQTGDEASLGSLLALTPDQGLAIGSAIGLLFAGAWLFQPVIQTFKGGSNEEHD